MGELKQFFEGPKDRVEEMVKKCKEGPRIAGVEHLDVSWEEATGEFSGFEIVR